MSICVVIPAEVAIVELQTSYKGFAGTRAATRQQLEDLAAALRGLSLTVNNGVSLNEIYYRLDQLAKTAVSSAFPDWRLIKPEPPTRPSGEWQVSRYEHYMPYCLIDPRKGDTKSNRALIYSTDASGTTTENGLLAAPIVRLSTTGGNVVVE